MFGEENTQPSAAREFRRRVDKSKLLLVIGGKLKRELIRNSNFKIWYGAALSVGRIRNVSDNEVEKETENLKKSAVCHSNDQHVLALAKVSKARLLYTSDQNLMDDFRNVNLIPHPKGKIYKTPSSGAFTEHHRKLLDRNNCRK